MLVSISSINTYANEKKPNIVVILADDLGYGDLGFTGSKEIKTPNIDALANNGVSFKNAYVTHPYCGPSRVGLLTGRYQARFGMENNVSYMPQDKYMGLPLSEKTLANRLQDVGYHTSVFGKWHLGGAPHFQPNKRGFDFFFGMLGGGHDYWPTLDKNKLFYNDKKPEEIRATYLTDWFTIEAIDFISAKANNDPWFLYLSYNTPHSPMQAKSSDLEKFKHIKHKTRRIYCAMQHCMDENIGKIVASLKKQNQLDNTLIVFISDNGGSVEVSNAVNAPLRGTKGTFLEGGIRVPTIYHWPAKLKPAVYKKPVISLDFMATFVKAAGGTPPAYHKPSPREGRADKKGPIYDSVNLIPHFTGENSADPHEFLAWRTATRGSAIRVGKWKLLQPLSEATQLYDLTADPGETNNLASKHPEIVASLFKKRMSWEVSFERMPMFMSAAKWGGYNAKLYQKQYSLEQPAPDNTEDIWAWDYKSDK